MIPHQADKDEFDFTYYCTRGVHLERLDLPVDSARQTRHPVIAVAVSVPESDPIWSVLRSFRTFHVEETIQFGKSRDLC